MLNCSKRLWASSLIFCLTYAETGYTAELEISGKIGVEGRYFVNEPLLQSQLDQTQASLVIEPELYWQSDDGSKSFTFKPFYRKDSQDTARSHGDIRELSYVYASDNGWEMRTGIRKEFWGVTEFQHLVDVINQTDTVEDFDGEDKLGQLMINYSGVYDWGILDVFVLPNFRERTFPGVDGRLRAPIIIDEDNVSYESSKEDEHIDLAIRWSHSVGNIDIGTHWFRGTNREPILHLDVGADGQTPALLQYYQQMEQVGLDAQMIAGDTLWKLETIYRNTNTENHWATQAGFEHTLYGVFDSVVDLGLLMEHSWDSRGEGDENEVTTNFQNDLYVGARLAINDAQSSELLMGIGTDLEHNASSFIFEFTRRVGNSIKVSADIRIIQSSESSDLLYGLKEDDHLQLTMDWYF
ncbi:hypothetical protein [Agaribacter marinus]|uniref:Porin n=1 Tax=Agaribacter marinus TaxID=1431249 RepID=A0AA37WHR5_9ALTE|nr:hypothetical protein [Agaribacter marinus]GLR70308.1 hypothetical protein GCM10007852_12160 [Agaribacter marinus]